MKISTKGRYALRLMIDLALNDTGENVSIKAMLNRAGYVKSERGSNGGYKLTKKPEEYTVGMILRLTEGSLAITTCTEDEQNQCERYGSCPTVHLWEKLNKAISDVVDNITIADLAEEERSALNNFVI